jgi:hypothetical protein
VIVVDSSVWIDFLNGHPLPVPKDMSTSPISSDLRSLLVDGARRAGFLDYRVMLRTHLLANAFRSRHLPISFRGCSI